jgi:hypothetical protein
VAKEPQVVTRRLSGRWGRSRRPGDAFSLGLRALEGCAVERSKAVPRNGLQAVVATGASPIGPTTATVLPPVDPGKAKPVPQERRLLMRFTMP